MRIIRDLALCSAEYKAAVIALGNFDGVHLGHQAILREAIAIAKKRSAPSAVMTFDPHPREFFAPNQKKLRICSLRSKIELFSGLGVDVLFLVRFNKTFSSLSPESFVSNVLHHDLAASHVVSGYNFAFGKNRSGNTEFLTKISKQLGFGFTACEAIYDASGVSISSSAIRDHLAAGNVKKASELLGRTYTIEGKVRHGQKNGQKLGFPTANLSLKSLFSPRYGVYAVRFIIENEKQWHNGVVNLGIRPTFNQTEPLLEVHGFDIQHDLYGKRIRVELVEHVRDERRFPNIDALKSQITLDCIQTKSILQNQP